MDTTRHFTARFAFVLATLLLVAGLVRAAEDRAAVADKERQLIAVLESDAPPAAKAITCKRLAIYGSEEAVPALAALLPNEELSSWARIALEVIPGPAADDALRDATGRMQGRLLVGVINSIGVRRDSKAVDVLAERLKDADAQVAAAAAVALGRIGDAGATRTLERSLGEASSAVRSAVAQGCVLCAERLLAGGQADDAAELYDKVRTADLPEQRILEAIRGAILARQSGGIPLLVEQLESPDKRRFAMGLSTARELSGQDVTEALVSELGKAPPNRQALLILALADRHDSAVLPAILEAAASGAKEVRIVAVGVLKRVGDVSCIPALLERALDTDPQVVEAAKSSLEGLPGPEVDADLATRLSHANGKMRRLLIELVGLRRIDAIPDLLQAADDSDPQIRRAALTALGSTIGPENLSVLITRVVTPKHSEDLRVAERALRAASIRMADREACAEELVTAMSQAPVAAKGAILEILGAMGGTTALESVASAAKSDIPELQDVSSRVLGQWMTPDAAPALLEMAKSSVDDKYRGRALRGYLRIARQFNMPDQQRAEMCRTALDIAQRDDEKELVLTVLEQRPSLPMLRLAVDAVEIPSLKSDARRVALAIAEKIDDDSADAKKLLAAIGLGPVKIEIVKAEYGAGPNLKDVTELLRKYLHSRPLIALPSPSYNESFGGDPAPGVPKQLKVQYKIDGKQGEASFTENAAILLPAPEAK